MAIIVSDNNREKIKQAVQDFMDTGGIVGKVVLEFDNTFDPPPPPNDGEVTCSSQLVGGRWVVSCR